MRILIAVAAASLLAGPSWADEKSPEARGESRLEGILVAEAQRPAGAPARGETAWDLTERAVYSARKARTMFADTQKYAVGIGRKEAEWAALNERIARVESAYRGHLFVAMLTLYDSFTSIGGASAGADMFIKERELYSGMAAPAGARAAFTGKPQKRSMKTMRLWREDAESKAVEAEERLEKGLSVLRGRGAVRAPIYPDYLHDLVSETEELMERAAVESIKVAKAQQALCAKRGLYSQTIRAIEAYGGAAGKGPFRESDRAEAVRLSNEAKRNLVANEYHLAYRIEEARTLAYLLDTYGKL